MRIRLLVNVIGKYKTLSERRVREEEEEKDLPFLLPSIQDRPLPSEPSEHHYTEVAAESGPEDAAAPGTFDLKEMEKMIQFISTSQTMSRETAL